MNTLVSTTRSLLIDTRILTLLVLVVATAALAVPLFVISNPYTIILPTAALSAALLSGYYHLKRPAPLTWDFETDSATTFKILCTLWFLSLTVAVILYYSRGFERSLWVNLVLLLLYLLPLGMVFVSKQNRVVVALLIATGMVHRGFIYVTNPLAYGVDPHGHYNTAIQIAETGSMAPLEGSKSFFAPFYHLSGAIGSVLLNIPVPQGSMFLVLVVAITVTTALLVYHLTAVHWNWQAGVIALTLYLTGDFVVGDLLALGTTELGLLFFALVVYSAIWYLKTTAPRQLLLFVGTLFALTFTHDASVFVAVLIVVIFIGMFLFLHGISSRLLNLSSITGVVLLFDWTTGHVGDGRTFLEWIASSFFASLFRTTGAREEVQTITPADLGFVGHGPMASSGFIHVTGTGLLLTLSIFGILYYTSIKNKDQSQVFLIIGAGAAVLMVLMFTGSVFGLNVFVPSRWFKHLYFLLAIPAGVGVLGLISVVLERRRTRNYVFVLLVALTIPYMVFMGGNLNGAIDDPVFDDAPGAERMSFTDSEVATIHHSTIYSTDETTAYGDTLLRSPIGRYHESGMRSSQITIDIDEGNSIITSGDHTLVVVREHLYTGKAGFQIVSNGQTMRVRGETPLDHQILNGYSLVYQAESGNCRQPCGIYKDET